MIFLLGETAAAREIAAELTFRGIEFRQPAFDTALETDQGLNLTDISLVIDAAHPGASSRLNQLRSGCEQAGIPYVRLERPATMLPESPLLYPAESWEEALTRLADRVEALRQSGRRPTVFVTTGSYQLENLVSRLADKARLVVRVLPEGRLVQKCQDLGFSPRDLVAMQGTFSKDINRSLFKFYGANLLLTRDSGAAGGTDTKIAAALSLGMEIVLVKRAAASQGFALPSVKELLAWLESQGFLDDGARRQIR